MRQGKKRALVTGVMLAVFILAIGLSIADHTATLTVAPLIIYETTSDEFPLLVKKN